MHEISSLECSRIAQDLQIRKVQVEGVVQLLHEGNTVPFLSCFRKERTGGLSEDIIRQIQTRVNFLRQLADRKLTILKSIEAQGKLTEDLKKAVLGADTSKRLDDLYLPFKAKKKSTAAQARDKGLEPLALAIWNRDAAAVNLDELLPTLVNPEKDLKSVDEVRGGVQQILAEMIADVADVRAVVRKTLWETGKIKTAKSEKLQEGQGQEYKDYFEFSESTRQIPAHRILALNRGEKENALKVQLEFKVEQVQQAALWALAEYLHKRDQSPPSPLTTAVSPVSVAEPQPQTTPASAETVPPAPAPDVATNEPSKTEEPPPVTEPPPEAACSAPPLAAALAPSGEVMRSGEPLAPGSEYVSPHADFLRKVLDDALTRLILPSLEKEIRNELTQEAEAHAVAVFARNLRSLLMQPPLRDRRVLAIDPGLRNGCRLVALDEQGGVLEHVVLYPFGAPPKKGRDKGKKDSPPPGPAAAGTTEASTPALSSTETPASPAPVEPATAATAENVAAVAGTAEHATAEHAPSEPSAPPTPANAADLAPSPPAVSTPDASASTTAQAPATEPVAPAPPPTDPALAATGETVEAVDSKSPSAGESQEAKTEGPDRKAEAKLKIKELIDKHRLQVVALGNGPGCRETEELVAELIAEDLADLVYVIVNEAGASPYAVSSFGREEFPNLDSGLRATVSIGRRLQDPLNELVKVDPSNIGVGLYQHDINRKELKDSLEAVVESCVNQVGADINTATVPLLRHISGLNQLSAREIVEYRQKHGNFASREQLQQVPGMSGNRYVQAVGFLKVKGSTNPLDETWIHPESYAVAEKLLAELGSSPAAITDPRAHQELGAKLQKVSVEELAQKNSIGLPTAHDLIQALLAPGYDPREDLPPPIFKKGILKFEDLQPGMELKGTVLNVVDFGAFVDIGLKDSGLVHISQMANRYIKSPYDVVAVSDVVTVWVLQVDKDRHRVSLTMIKPGTERKPAERKPQQAREQRPRGPRPQQAPGQGQGRGPGERGRRPPRGRPGQQQQSAAASGAAATPEGAAAGQDVAATAPPAARTPPPPPPRRPRREVPKPKLSQAALEGKAPLRTFGELSVLFAVKKETKKPEEQPQRSEEHQPVSVPAEPEAPPPPAADQQPPGP